MTFLKAMIALGAVSLALGALALLRSQPYEVFYPLLLVGTLSFVIPFFLQPIVRRHYETLELRKMTAQDRF